MPVIGNDFQLYQGTKLTVTIPIVDGSGDPLTITGATIAWQAWAPGGTAAVISKTNNTGITIVNVNGTADGVQIVLDAADTTSLSAREYNHECRITLSGDPDVSVEGEMKLYKSLTN